jgi:hypothetical protein
MHDNAEVISAPAELCDVFVRAVAMAFALSANVSRHGSLFSQKSGFLKPER